MSWEIGTEHGCRQLAGACDRGIKDQGLGLGIKDEGLGFRQLAGACYRVQGLGIKD